MLIVYNPPIGKPIKGYNFGGKVVALHAVKEMKYYEDNMAHAIVANYPFLSIVTPDEVKELKQEQVQEEKKMSEPPLYVAKKDRVEEKLDPEIPVAALDEVIVEKDKGTEIPDDLKGSDWYGEGVKETKDDQ